MHAPAIPTSHVPPGHERTCAAALWARSFCELVVALEDRLRDPPEGVGGEAGRQREQQQLAPTLVGDRRERAFAARRLASAAERELEREHPDDRERDAFGDQTDASECR